MRHLATVRLHMLVLLASAILAALAFGLGSMLVALGSPSAEPVYYACLKNGNLTKVGTAVLRASDCPNGATVIHWNQQGPPGLQGPPGSPTPPPVFEDYRVFMRGTENNPNHDLQLIDPTEWTVIASYPEAASRLVQQTCDAEHRFIANGIVVPAPQRDILLISLQDGQIIKTFSPPADFPEVSQIISQPITMHCDAAGPQRIILRWQDDSQTRAYSLLLDAATFETIAAYDLPTNTQTRVNLLRFNCSGDQFLLPELGLINAENGDVIRPLTDVTIVGYECR